MAMSDLPTPTLLLLDLPSTPSAPKGGTAATLAGLNLLSFTPGPRFRGITHLPPGRHLAFVAAGSAVVERWGVWFDVPAPGQGQAVAAGDASTLTVLRWDPMDECLVVEVDPAELLRCRANLGRIMLEGGLVGYERLAPDASEKPAPRSRVRAIRWEAEEPDEADAEEEDGYEWSTLTSHLTRDVLSRILGPPSGSSTSSPPGLQTDCWRFSSTSASPRDAEPIPGVDDLPARNGSAGSNLGLDAPDSSLNLLPIELRQTWREGATGRERTAAAQDRSWALSQLLATHCHPSEPTTSPIPSLSSSSPTSIDEATTHLIGELQFTFLALLTLTNLSCASQWQRLVKLLLTCIDAAATDPPLFATALATLRQQLRHARHAPDALALLDLADEGAGAWLVALLRRFRRGISGLLSANIVAAAHGHDGLQAVRRELDALELFLRSGFGWEMPGASGGAGLGRRRAPGAVVLADGEVVRGPQSAMGEGSISAADAAFPSADDDEEEDDDDETGEFAPLLVDLTPEQARMLGLEGVDLRTAGARGMSTLEVLSRQMDEEGGRSDEDVSGAGHGSGATRVVESDAEDDEGGGEDEEEMGDLDDMDARY